MALDPLMVNFRLRKDDKGNPVGSAECNAAIVAITGLTIPNEYPRLSEDWRQTLKDPNSPAYAQLREDLAHLSDEIDDLNASPARRFVNRDFHPDYVAVSTFS